ncbi:MAG: OmpA family protein [Hyphomicrobiaceae bacterium]
MRFWNVSVAAGVSLLAIQAATAQDLALPKWKIDDICGKQEVSGYCARNEERMRNAVSGSWSVLPDDVKKTCIEKTQAYQSWRTLGDCIDEEARKNVDRHAIKTAPSQAELAEAKRIAEAEAKRKVEAEAKRKAEAEAEAKRKAEAEAKRKADAEAEARRAAEAAEAKRKADAEAEAKRLAEAAEAKRKADAEAEAKRQQMAALSEKQRTEASGCEALVSAIGAQGAINFGTASVAVEQTALSKLEQLANAVKGCPGARIEISGHTDNDGTLERNQVLSEQRARFVADYLTRSGIDAARINTVGYGQTKPIVPNDSPLNREKNRRIEYTIKLN